MAVPRRSGERRGSSEAEERKERMGSVVDMIRPPAAVESIGESVLVILCDVIGREESNVDGK